MSINKDQEDKTIPSPSGQQFSQRIAKRMANAGLCSRRDAERWIEEGRVYVNGKKILSPALNVTEEDEIVVDEQSLSAPPRPRLWLYHKLVGVITTHKDPQGRPTLFEQLPEDFPRVISVGRLDLNSEGLILLTNNSAIAHYAEKPTTGWKRIYRVRAYGAVTQKDLDQLKQGITVDDIHYGPINARLELAREASTNRWMRMELTEGKNREIRNVLRALGLHVNRLIRTHYGPFEMSDILPGSLEEVPYEIIQKHFSSLI